MGGIFRNRNIEDKCRSKQRRQRVMTTKQETLNKIKAELGNLKAGNSWIDFLMFSIFFLITYAGYYWCFSKWGADSTMRLTASALAYILFQFYKNDLLIIKLNKRISDIENKLEKKV